MADPTRYWLERDGQVIGINNTPAAGKTLRVYYIKNPETLQAGEDEPFDGIVKFERFHDAIVSGTVAKILTRLGEQRAFVYQREFDSAVSGARKLSQSQLDAPIAVIGVSQ